MYIVAAYDKKPAKEFVELILVLLGIHIYIRESRVYSAGIRVYARLGMQLARDRSVCKSAEDERRIFGAKSYQMTRETKKVKEKKAAHTHTHTPGR